MRDGSATSESGDANGMLPEADSFDTLLEGLSGRHRRDGKNAPLPDECDVLNLIADLDPPHSAGSETSNPVFVLLEGLLPRVLPQAPSAGSDDKAQSSDAASQLMPSETQQIQDSGDLLGSPVQQRVTVAVQHQETHFKPVIEASVTEADIKDERQESASEFASVDKFMDRPSKAVHPRHQDLTRYPLPQEAATPVDEEQVEEQNLDKDQSLKAAAERLEARKSAPSSAAQTEGASIPPATLQRLASSVRAEVRSMVNEAAQHAASTDRTIHMFSIKASDSALRILNLQLHPADLGVVTIKMRLAGDSLEMELHTEKEDTAQLLRNDSEKLSALLRGSGYRPDAIIIQVNGIADQDRVSPQRQQSDMQFQGQSFEQGGASQEGHSRNREKQYASTRTEPLNNRTEDGTLGSRNPGGVYL
ncbi:flagellar hook-length control protein FliK [Microvirga sp. KLBC 81]|uniref:flagellar hook-length control protein FliK n=1 Tax=Microvirga sp. KLBC 81 TaxID=1862707 RepID=UPI001403C9F4|nr:flagellar hook-length control protein FliK [Microvirga sp. KLBC 81]